MTTTILINLIFRPQQCEAAKTKPESIVKLVNNKVSPYSLQ